ncbi:HesA/MoeB/ThiF family protein [Myceligenerans salitolerans]|uniref:HesA/MoeB/ThiF family protein n=1 Tax=Myceligenerans salitolerans TaxID=1230528 RepID=A0ABS3I613_9MICO|nr:HesA/MoeB/ThiF family protein [Myceligenerans salitolerans]MBO0608408.1 HesA/MoeB/ThiF family protein [Myceligenerans salitolerans]
MTSLPPLVPLRGPLPPEERRRAARHLLLDGFGPDAQARLAGARVVVIGAGGLGSPVLQYLAAAGVGTLGIVDDDVVAPSNLQRQVLHGDGDADRPKTTSAADALRVLRGPGLKVTEHRLRLDEANARELLAGYDLVVDGSDTFATRYAVSDAAAALGMPVVWGTVLGWDGQVAVWWSAAPDGRAITYPDVFGPQPPEGESCETVGVLGPACGAVGSAMAVEAVKLLTGTGDVALGRILVYDARTSGWDTIPLTAPEPASGPRPASAPEPALAPEPASVPDDGRPPAATGAGRPGPPGAATTGAGTAEAAAAVRLPDGVLVVDVGRLPARLPAGTPAVRAGLEALAAGDLPTMLADHPPDAPIVVVCEQGLRSRGAAMLLTDLGWRDVTPAGHLLFT